MMSANDVTADGKSHMQKHLVCSGIFLVEGKKLITCEMRLFARHH